MNTLVHTKKRIDCSQYTLVDIMNQMNKELQLDKKIHHMCMTKNTDGTIECPIMLTNDSSMKGMMRNKVHNEQRKWKIESRLKNKLKNRE